MKIIARSVSKNPALFSERLEYRLSEDDTDILNGVVIIDFDVAFGRYFEIEAAVLGKQGEHVIEERNASLDVRMPLAVDIDDKRSIGRAAHRGEGVNAHTGDARVVNGSWQPVVQPGTSTRTERGVLRAVGEVGRN